MAVKKHLLLRIAGDYTAAGLESEIWQTDVRLLLNFGGVAAIGTLPDDWDPIATTIARTETDWTITGNWKAEKVAVATFSPDDYLNDQAAPAVADYFLANLCSDQVRVRSLALYPIGAPSGNAVPAVPYAVGTPCLLEYTSGYPTGSASSTQLPLQDSIVVSHKGSQIGPKGRGRMFLPSATSSALTGTKIQTAKVTNLLDAHVAFLEALSIANGVPSPLFSVRPIITGAPWSSFSTIAQVRVGNIVDTQRRRRNRLVEVVQSANPTYP
jgi:hypothetical protein